jgi:hypothetical protein
MATVFIFFFVSAVFVGRAVGANTEVILLAFLPYFACLAMTASAIVQNAFRLPSSMQMDLASKRRRESKKQSASLPSKSTF